MEGNDDSSEDIRGAKTKEKKSSLLQSKDSPPQLSVKLPKTSELQNTSEEWYDAELPIDVLLLTVEDCEFLSCFHYLDKPFRSWHKEIGYVYFGSTGSSDQEKLKIALIKCSKGSAEPGGSSIAVKNAVKVLRPKAVFSVGTCSGLSPDKAKLGDVIVSSTLTTPSGFKTPVTRNIGLLIRHIDAGWVAPLENPDEREVRVHRDGDILSQRLASRFGWRHEDVVQQYPEAIAIESEGEGLYAAAYDDKVEWLIVKGVASFGDPTQPSSGDWMAFASTMAASVVANILNDPRVFQEWQHYGQGDIGEHMNTEMEKLNIHCSTGRNENEKTRKRKREGTEDEDDVGEKVEQTRKESKKGKKTRMDENEDEDNLQVQKPITWEPQAAVQKIKDDTLADTEQLTDLQQPFRTNPGEGPEAKDLSTDQIYVNAVIHEGRVRYNFPTDRWEQLKVYPTPNGKQSKSVRPEDIFDAQHNNVLVVGRPGIGKTMLSTKLLRMWASGNPKMKNHFAVAFLLKFRHLNSETDLNLYELLNRAEAVENLDDEVWSYIKENPTKVLLIFDGIDEFSARSDVAQDDSYYKNTGETKMPLHCLYRKLVSGKLLCGCTVITTTRPTAVECVRNLKFKRTVEILGFTSEQIEDYVEKFTTDDHVAKETIWQHISTNINLFSLCYIPMNCFIICHCLLQLIKLSIFDGALQLPTKMTEIYSMTVKIFYYKHNRDDKYSCSKTDLGTYMYKPFKQLYPANEMVFKRLGKIAFNGIKQGRLIFESSEVHGLEHCGLLHRLPDAKRRSLSEQPKAQYCFLHLTMQEFFAAKHVTDTMTKEELQRFVADYINEGAWQVVIQFVAGLLEPDPDQEMSNVDIFSELLPMSTEEQLGKSNWFKEGRIPTSWPAKVDGRLALNVCKCLYEMNVKQQSTLENKLAEIGFNGVYFQYCSLAPIECAAVLHALKNVNRDLYLDLSDNGMGTLGCVEISRVLKDENNKLTKLSLDNNSIGDQGAAHLCDALKDENNKLTRLSLANNGIGDQGAAHLCDALKDENNKLTGLNLGSNNISEQGAAHLCDALKNKNCKLTDLNLCNNDIGEQGAAHLCDALKDKSCKLTNLYLKYNKVGDQGAAHLCNALKDTSCKLTKLYLRYHNIGHQGAADLCDVLKDKNCKLTFLDLCYNNIGEQGAAHLCDALKDKNCKLTHLYLSSNNIGEQGAAHLCDALRDKNCKLTTLHLGRNHIGDQGAALLCDALKDKNCKLTNLYLAGNNIREEVVAHLCVALQDVPCQVIFSLLDTRKTR